MADWPSSLPEPSVTPAQHRKGQVKAPFKGGYVHSHAAETRAREAWELSWDGLSQTHLNTLFTFFDANIGGTFNWTWAADDATYVVRFAEDEIKYDYIGKASGDYKVSLSLEEN